MAGNHPESNPCPVSAGMRKILETGFSWLLDQFGRAVIQYKPVRLPDRDHFPIDYDGSEKSMLDTAAILARQMDLDFTALSIGLFDVPEESSTRTFGDPIGDHVRPLLHGETDPDYRYPKNEAGKYDVFLERGMLNDPDGMIAVLAREFANIKLLGENRIQRGDEALTDMATVIFGMGVLNANAGYRVVKTYRQQTGTYGPGPVESTYTRTDFSTLGCLTQPGWGYCLALYAYSRREEHPAWTGYLNKTLQADFLAATKFIQDNRDRVLKEFQ